MKIKVILFSIILILLSTNVFAQKKDASAAVQSFYKFYLSRSGIFNADEVKAYRKWFTNNLNKLFQTALKHEEEYLKANPTNKGKYGDGFPFRPYEECSKNGKYFKNNYRVGTAEFERERATVEVKFYRPKECGGEFINTYKVELVKSKGKWLIDD